MKILITFIVLFSFRIACCRVQTDNTRQFSKYSLPEESSKMCTVHVKPFRKDAKTLSIFEDIIQANANKFIFTTWTFNDSSTHPQVHLLDSFHEQCTVNIIIEGPEANTRDLEIMSHYVASTGFGQFSEATQSIFIQIKQNCLFAVGSHNYILPHILLIHFEQNCLLAYGIFHEDSIRFPNIFFDPRGSFNYYVVNRMGDSFEGSRTMQEVRNRLNPNATLSMLAQIRPIAQDWRSTDCSKLRLATQYFNKGLYCSTDTYVLLELRKALKLNFYPVTRSTLFDSGNLHEQNAFRGSISKPSQLYFPSEGKPPLPLKYTRFNLESLVMDLLLYCEPPRQRGTQISFRAWWSAFQPNVWLIGLFVFFITSFAISCVMSADVGLVFGFHKILLSIFNVFRSVMKQNSSSEAKLLMLFTFASFVFTSVYENIITSDLIVPDKPYIVQDLDELLKLNFKVLIPAYSKIMAQNILHQNSHPAKTKIYNSGGTKFFDADFHDIPELAREEKNRIGIFLIGELQEFPLELFKIQQGIGSTCHLVRKPVGSAHRYFAISSSVQNQVYALIEKYREAGLLEVWYKTEIYFKSIIQRRHDPNLYKDDQYTDTDITLLNLIPVFMLWVPGFLVSFLAFTIETKWYVKLWVIFMQHLRSMIRKTIQKVASFRKEKIRPSVHAKISGRRKLNW
jgi:hypothetical protein